MTLFEAPNYDPAKERRRAMVIPVILVLLLVGAFLTWHFWNWPAEHRVSRFFNAIEQKDLEKAYGIWNADPNWKQHSDKYTGYPFGAFTLDWGPSGEWGTITSHQIEASKNEKLGVIVAVRLNGMTKRKFLWVDKKDQTLGTSPYELRVE